MASLLGIDYGDKRVGVAIGYLDEHMVLPLTVLDNDDTLAKHLDALMNEHHPQSVVIGLPQPRNHQDPGINKAIKAFAKECQQTWPCEVILVNEENSSHHASRKLSQAGLSQKKQRGKLDAHAAVLILQQYMGGEK
ncbi:MAG: Holliday junction resolvase RuvX [bacterium]